MMNKQLLCFAAALAFCAVSLPATAQTLATRYLDRVFPASEIQVQKDIVYVNGRGQYPADFTDSNPDNLGPYALECDVYSPPASDTIAERPVLVLACGGSFLTPNATGEPPLGTKEDHPIVELCTRFAQRGYVTVSMDYRRGWNPIGAGEVPQQTIVRAAYRAVQDGRAMVRYLKKHVAEDGNTWGIDTSRIAFGGSQSGGYIPIHMYLLNSYDAVFNEPKIQDANNVPYVDTTFLGPIEGRFGNLQYSDEFQLIISMGAAALDTSFLLPGMPPILGVHGTEDDVTPYGTDIVVAGGLVPVVEVSGSGDLVAYSASIGNQDPLLPDFAGDVEPGLLPLFGAGFQPYAYYDSDLDGPDPDNLPDDPEGFASAVAYLDSTTNFLAPRMFKVLGLPTIEVMVTSRQEDQQLAGHLYRVYPNPSEGVINLALNTTNGQLQLAEVTDLSGRLVLRQAVAGQQDDINISALPTGVYLLRVQTTEGLIAEKIMKQ